MDKREFENHYFPYYMIRYVHRTILPYTPKLIPCFYIIRETLMQCYGRPFNHDYDSETDYSKHLFPFTWSEIMMFKIVYQYTPISFKKQTSLI